MEKQQEINKYLTEAMGECWHDYKPYKKDYDGILIDTFKCVCGFDNGHCEHTFKVHLQIKNLDFSTWQGFGKLWEWATKQEWWDNFLMEISCDLTKGILSTEDYGLYMPQCIVKPTNFANAIYEFLKNKIG